MKVVERIALVVYSYIILILATVLSLMIVGLLDIEIINTIVEHGIEGEISSKIILAINVILILLSIRCIFFDNNDNQKEKEKQGILLQNENGKLLISKETIENLTNTVIKKFESVEQINTKTMIDKENNLVIMINLVVGQNVIIKELSVNLQNKIKETMKNTLDLDVKEVNIKVRSYIAKNESNEE